MGNGVFAYVVNPIRVLIVCWKNIMEMHVLLRVFGFIAVLFPIPLIIPYGRRIYELYYKNESAWGKRPEYYQKSPDEYKTPSQFHEELRNRGLLFDDGDISGSDCTELDSDYDRKPVYEYSALMCLSETDGKIGYAQPPCLSDYYVDCRIFYVDGDLYAVIGISESDAVRKHFAPSDKPYCMILAEKESITTYVDGKYYSNGAIRVGKGPVEMLPCHEESMLSNYHPALYPIRKVERLDFDSINRVAVEVRDLVLGRGTFAENTQN